MTQTRQANGSADDLRDALEVLRRGGVILYPTDTVWGIGCDAACSEAVERIYSIKQRPDSKALITLVASEAMLERSVAEVPDVAWQLLEVAVDPLTVVYDRGCGVAPELLAPDGSIGIRLVRDCFAAGWAGLWCRHRLISRAPPRRCLTPTLHRKYSKPWTMCA